MRKMKIYLRSLWLSATDPSYYQDILLSKPSFSIQFFLVSIAFFTCLQVLVLFTFILPRVQTDLRLELQNALQQVPDSMILHYHSHILSVEGVTLPVNIKLSNRYSSDGLPSNLIVIEASQAKTDALFTLTPNQAYLFPNTPPDNPLKYSDLTEINAGDINKKQLGNLGQSFISVLPTALQSIVLFSLPGLFVIFVGINLVRIMIFSIFVQTIGWLLKQRISYKKAFQLGLHIQIVCLIVSLLTQILVPMTQLPLQSMAYVGITILVMLDLRQHLRAK